MTSSASSDAARRASAVDHHELLTLPEVAEFLRTTPQAIHQMIARAKLPGVVRVGRRTLVRRDDLLRYLEPTETNVSRPGPGEESASTPAPEVRRASALEHELLTVDEAAALLKTSKGAVYERAGYGRIPGVVRIGRRLLFNAATLRRHLGLL